MEIGPQGSDSLVRILILQDGLEEVDMFKDFCFALYRREEVRCIAAVCSFRGMRPRKIYSNDAAYSDVFDSIENMVEWADLLLVACIQADTMAKMLHGIADTLLLRMLRSWNVAKKIAIIPGMSRLMWENPMTRKQLNKIRRKWTWIRVLDSLVWDSKEHPEIAYEEWTGMHECVDVIENQIDLLTLGHDLVLTVNVGSRSLNATESSKSKLPSELWSIVLEHTGDWELARTLGIYTTLPVPVEWQGCSKISDGDFVHDLEWIILVGNLQDIVRLFQTRGPPKSLSRLCVKLIIKFARTDILSYFEGNYNYLFWSQFGHALLPTKASAVFGQTAILDWWQQSPSFLNKDYNADAIDLASKSGYVHVLQWWRDSGLPLRYTDAALEQASAQGQVGVLDWWRSASKCHDDDPEIRDSEHHVCSSNTLTEVAGTNSRIDNQSPLRLKVGKSLIYASQNGQATAIRWWMSSGIPTVHEEAVARTASANGHVNILQLWKEIKGEKMQYDNQVLVGPTKNGHVDVLEWWKTQGYRVEYKTCDIEEALEDSVGGQKETRIRSWWARNGLNLGVGTSEWMKVKLL